MSDNKQLVKSITENFLAPQDVVNIDDIETAFEKMHIKFPFLPINPPCNTRNQVYLESANDNVDMVVPGGALLMRLTGTGNFLMGSIDVDRLTSNVQDGSAPVLNPEGWYYCQGKSSINIMALGDDLLVTAEFYIG